MRIAVIGSGYVGLVSGTCFADIGHDVVCIDNNAAKIDALNHGIISIFEPGLEELVAKSRANGRLTFTTDLAGTVRDSDAVFIAVGTPSRAGDGFADLTHVFEASRQIARAVRGYTVIVVKSTVPVGIGAEIERIMRDINPDAGMGFASNPEFLREGSAIGDFMRPDRIVIGQSEPKVRAVMSEIYRPLSPGGEHLFFTSRNNSELIKYAANAFLAMKITFINEMADLCEAVGGDVKDVATGIGLDPRIGPQFLRAGPGYGGSCFPKDTLALMNTARDLGVAMRLVEATIAVNDQRKRTIARRVLAALGGTIRGRTIAILGLTFKPDTDDMRDAPSLDIIRFLQDQGATIRAYDPEGMDAARKLTSNVIFATDAYDAAQGADALVIVTEWNIFRALDFSRLKDVMKNPVVVDLRNIYDPEDVRRQAFSYTGVGR